MVRALSSATFATFIVALAILLPGCGADDDTRFPCGDHGGSCDRDTEICILGGDDRCSTCAPRPDSCDPEAMCGCLPPGTDAVYGAFKCLDAGTCEQSEGGLVLTCSEVEWGCG